MMNVFPMTIEGRDETGTAWFPVQNPATEEVFAKAPECDLELLNRAVDSARRAFSAWSADARGRRRLLRLAAEVIRNNLDELAELLTLEQGKPIHQARREINSSARNFDEFADLSCKPELLVDDDTRRVELHRKPLGVVAAITPWNFPVVLATLKIAPALLAGNTVVVKPSPYTPLATLRMGTLLQEVFPPGVLNVISGGDQLGADLTAHPDVRKVSFTGSVSAGKHVAVAAARDLKRVTLELGGNDPAIVLADTNPAVVAHRLFEGAFYNCGQICMAVKRVYAHERIFQALVEQLVAIAEEQKTGDGLDPETTIGPINNEPQYARVIELVEEARRNGAQFPCGGTALDRKGYFFKPTIVTEVLEGMRLVDEEQFGPVLPILSYTDLDDAVRRANATPYGLGASVWTEDPVVGAEVAARLDTGTSWVNQHAAVGNFAPFGGAKWSGIGAEGGTWGVDAFIQNQVINVRKSSSP